MTSIKSKDLENIKIQQLKKINEKNNFNKKI